MISKLLNIIYWTIFCSAIFLSGCVSAVFTGANVYYNRYNLAKKVSDIYITMQIKHALANDQLLTKQIDLSVATFHRIVLLTGRVPNAAIRVRAATLASEIPNTAHVYNAITIGPPFSAAVNAHDTWITTKIKTQLITNNNLEPGTIKIITADSVVYLMGIVPHDQADIAVEIARNTLDVKQVVKIFFYMIMPKLD
jgi:osmotically-inducible protein OsmY